MNNSIFTIFPYKIGNCWAFDDEKVGLHAEALVAGADSLLDILGKGRTEVAVVFSASEFPSYDVKLDLVNTSPTGSNYIYKELNHALWLCPALFLYLPIAPQELYIQIK